MSENFKLLPTGDNLLVKVVELENKTSSGIILTKQEISLTEVGEVIAVGPEVDFLVTKINSKVMFMRHARIPVMNKEDGLVIVKAKDVIAVLSE